MIVEEDFAGYQTIGKRPYQQDAYAFCPPDDDSQPLLMVVADGVGGQDAGELASTTAVRAYLNGYFQQPEVDEAAKMLAALHAAHREVKEGGRELEERCGNPVDLATTLTAVHYFRQAISWISVGDSPLFHYIAAEDKVTRLNVDHSMRSHLADEVAAGRMSEEAASQHPDRNSLVSAISIDDIEIIDQPSEMLALHSGDLLLLGSDGLFTLSDAELHELLRSNRDQPARTIARRLISSVVAHNRSNQDNATAAVLKA